MTVLNAPRPEAEIKLQKTETVEKAVQVDKPVAPVANGEKTEKAPAFMTASAGGLAVKAQPPVAAGTKCRVLTASYGGQKAVIIRAQADGAVNFTVLEVNEGTEQRETDAYIQAYAKGGAVDAMFTNHTQALEKAFELCPEG